MVHCTHKHTSKTSPNTYTILPNFYNHFVCMDSKIQFGNFHRIALNRDTIHSKWEMNVNESKWSERASIFLYFASKIIYYERTIVMVIVLKFCLDFVICRRAGILLAWYTYTNPVTQQNDHRPAHEFVCDFMAHPFNGSQDLNLTNI